MAFPVDYRGGDNRSPAQRREGGGQALAQTETRRGHPDDAFKIATEK